MKRKGKVVLLLFLALSLSVFCFQVQETKATEFAGNEAKYNQICNGYIPADSPNRALCEEYRQYLINKGADASNSIADLNAQINAIGNDLDRISATSKQLSAQIEELNANIASIESTIGNIDAAIETAETNILQKEEDIEKRKDVVKERMVELQVKANTNQYIDYIMGASDLVDLIQRSSSIESFTKYDKELIGSLKDDMKALEEEKAYQEGLKEQQILQKELLENSKSEIEALHTANQELESRYFEQQKNLIEQKNEAIRQANMANGAADKIIFTEPIAPSNGLVNPVPSGYRSAGTWAYPGGGLHLGLDKATSIGSPIYAPANGVVLEARTGVNSSGGGYLGNMAGYPYGGGNTLHILVEADGQVYAMSFFHCSPMIISAGSRIAQGQVIGYTGNTGNSTGPHCHIEVFTLNMDFQSAINYWNSNYDWAWGCGWSAGGTCSGAGCRIRPENLGW